MAVRHCANCGSTSTQAGFDRIFCLDCGRETDLHGNLLPALVQVNDVKGYRGGSQQGVRKNDEED